MVMPIIVTSQRRRGRLAMLTSQRYYSIPTMLITDDKASMFCYCFWKMCVFRRETNGVIMTKADSKPNNQPLVANIVALCGNIQRNDKRIGMYVMAGVNNNQLSNNMLQRWQLQL